MRLIRPGRRIAVAGAAAVTPLGFAWRGLYGRVAAGEAGREVVRPPPDRDPVPPRLYAMAAPAARFAAVAMKLALDDAAWVSGRERIGLFLGVGASGGSMEELNHMLAASLDGESFSLARFGHAGLAACNPLFAFQLMNNFTLCHGAILAGLGGPNGALFSRGAGTFESLGAALDSLDAGECERALAGGADSARHPVTQAELRRDGQLDPERGASEGAALLALAVDGPARAYVDAWAVADGDDDQLCADCAAAPIDRIVLAPWGGAARATLARWARAIAPGAPALDVGAALGDSLAASPAIAWTIALDAIVHDGARRALVLAAGTDGAIGAALLGTTA
jgi:hypothetical protein